MQPSGPSHSLRRKLLTHFLNPTKFLEYKPRQEAETTKFLAHLLEFEGREVRGKEWVAVVDRFTPSIVFTLAYGRRIDSVDAEVVRKRREYTAFIASLFVPGAYKAEIFPFLKYTPEFLAPWKKMVREMGDRDRDFNKGLVASVKRDLRDSDGVGNGSLTSYLLEWQREKGRELLGEE